MDRSKKVHDPIEVRSFMVYVVVFLLCLWISLYVGSQLLVANVTISAAVASSHTVEVLFWVFISVFVAACLLHAFFFFTLAPERGRRTKAIGGLFLVCGLALVLVGVFKVDDYLWPHYVLVAVVAASALVQTALIVEHKRSLWLAYIAVECLVLGGLLIAVALDLELTAGILEFAAGLLILGFHLWQALQLRHVQLWLVTTKRADSEHVSAQLDRMTLAPVPRLRV